MQSRAASAPQRDGARDSELTPATIADAAKCLLFLKGFEEGRLGSLAPRPPLDLGGQRSGK
eukprot:2700353-Rhodomonas_salina.1